MSFQRRQQIGLPIILGFVRNFHFALAGGGGADGSHRFFANDALKKRQIATKLLVSEIRKIL